MWLQMILPPNPIQKNSTLLKHSKQDSAYVAPLRKQSSVHQDDPTKATIISEQFQSVFSRKSPNSLSSLCHMTLQERTDTDKSMLDITVTYTGIDSGTLPPLWKDANVVPVYKKGERSNPANYRPISLTCILCKTLEHIVASSITKHLSKLNISYELQHSFREKRSCESQLLMMVDDLFKSVYKKKQLSSFSLTSARPLIKSATRNSLSNYMTTI